MEASYKFTLDPIITPSGLKFIPERPPARVDGIGYQYVTEWLKVQEKTGGPCFEDLFMEVEPEHLLWEARLGNQHLLTALNEPSVFGEILWQAVNEGRPFPSSHALSYCSQSLQVAFHHDEPLPYTSVCVELLGNEVSNGGIFTPDNVKGMIAFFFSRFKQAHRLFCEGSPYVPPPPQISNLAQILAFRPHTKEKVIHYLVRTDPVDFTLSMLCHLQHLSVFNLLVTSISMISPCRPIAAQPSNQLKFGVIKGSVLFGIRPEKAELFNLWLIEGNFVSGLLDRILQEPRKPANSTPREIVEMEEELDARQHDVVTEHAAAIYKEIIIFAKRHIKKRMPSPSLFLELVSTERLKPFISAVLSHKNSVVVCEGLEIMEELLLYDWERQQHNATPVPPLNSTGSGNGGGVLVEQQEGSGLNIVVHTPRHKPGAEEDEDEDGGDEGSTSNSSSRKTNKVKALVTEQRQEDAQVEATVMAKLKEQPNAVAEKTTVVLQEIEQRESEYKEVTERDEDEANGEKQPVAKEKQKEEDKFVTPQQQQSSRLRRKNDANRLAVPPLLTGKERLEKARAVRKKQGGEDSTQLTDRLFSALTENLHLLLSIISGGSSSSQSGLTRYKATRFMGLVFNHLLSSFVPGAIRQRFFTCLSQCNFWEVVMDLLFNNHNNNVLHNAVTTLFRSVFFHKELVTLKCSILKEHKLLDRIVAANRENNLLWYSSFHYQSLCADVNFCIHF
ncbi:hypothetical protein QOT17_000092 [Balamuthia mandrillaris]